MPPSQCDWPLWFCSVEGLLCEIRHIVIGILLHHKLEGVPCQLRLIESFQGQSALVERFRYDIPRGITQLDLLKGLGRLPKLAIRLVVLSDEKLGIIGQLGLRKRTDIGFEALDRQCPLARGVVRIGRIVEPSG